MAEVVMPRLSDTMERGTIAKWLKKEGDRVTKGEPLVEIETDKANMVLDAYDEGVLERIAVREGQTVPIGEPIAYISSERTVGSAPAAAQVAPAGAKPPAVTPAPNAGQPTRPAEPEAEEEERLKVSPIARRIAQEHGIDLSLVKGSGPGGRIVKEDVEEVLRRQQGAPAGQPGRPAAPSPAAPQATGAGLESRLAPLSRMQHTIAQRMVESKSKAPHFYVTNEVNMDNAHRFLQELNRALGGKDKVGVNDLFIKAAGLALRKFPEVNASFRDDQIEYYERCNVGIAVAVPQGLVVPVLRDADRKTLAEIAVEVGELIAKTRSNRLAPAEREAGTFTVSNMGMFDVEQFAAIITPPQSAILAVGSIKQVPAVVDGEVRVVSQVKSTLSADHRVFYGATAAQFLQEMKRLLDNPLLLLL